MSFWLRTFFFKNRFLSVLLCFLFLFLYVQKFFELIWFFTCFGPRRYSVHLIAELKEFSISRVLPSFSKTRFWCGKETIWRLQELEET